MGSFISDRFFELQIKKSQEIANKNKLTVLETDTGR